MYCATASQDKDDAARVRRVLKRQLLLNSAVRYCDSCDAYHTLADINGTLEQARWKRWKHIITRLAEGLPAREIAIERSVNVRTIETDVYRMLRYFYAVNTANLVAIALSIGLVDPNEFVPKIGEHR